MNVKPIVRVGFFAVILFGGAFAASPAPSEQKVDDDKTVRDISFDAIKFDAKPGDAFDRSQITEKIEALVGQRIRIRGWILPTSVFKKKGIKEFVFVRDNMECCFGPKAALFDCIHVVMNRGTSCEFSDQPIAVDGVFKIEILEDPTDPKARPLAIYRLDAQSAKLP